jgi:hypothetical protein
MSFSPDVLSGVVPPEPLPTFSLQPQGVALLPHRQAAWAILQERLGGAADFGRRIEGLPALGLAPVCDALDRYARRLSET